MRDLLMKGLRIFLYTLAICLPVSIAGAESSLALITLMLLGLMVLRHRPAPFLPVPLTVPVLVFLFGHLVSALAGPDPLSSIASSDWIFLAMPLTLWSMRLTGDDRGPVTAFVVTGAVISIYAAAQHFLGIDLVRPAGREVVIPMDGVEGRYLAIGTFCHHLTFAHVYQFIFLFLLVFALRRPRDGMNLLRTLPALAVVGTSLVFSFSRGVWLSVTVSSILVVIVMWGRRGAVLALLSAVILFAALSASGPLGDRLKSVTSQEANSMRVIIFRSNWDAIKDHPITGLGPGRYQDAMMPYYERYDPPDIMPRVHAHNNFLQVWLNAGLIGLAGFVWLNVAFLRRAWISLRRNVFRRSTDRVLILAGSVGVVAFLVSGLTQYNLGDSEVGLTYWFVMGMVLAVSERSGGENV